jgi:hypothetical protein
MRNEVRIENAERKPLWQPPRIVVQGHISEVVATTGVGKLCYGPDADSEVGLGTCR